MILFGSLGLCGMRTSAQSPTNTAGKWSPSALVVLIFKPREAASAFPTNRMLAFQWLEQAGSTNIASIAAVMLFRLRGESYVSCSRPLIDASNRLSFEPGPFFIPSHVSKELAIPDLSSDRNWPIVLGRANVVAGTFPPKKQVRTLQQVVMVVLIVSYVEPRKRYRPWPR